jgi:hypothetical protein
MQIHELNQRRQINEVDLVGPNSIFNVGKQVVKNPAALVKSTALGAAQQAAAQSSAASSADTLAAQGYKVGGGIKPTVTTAQQLQTVKSNPAVQQQIKNLSSQWMAQSAALKKSKQPVTEAESIVPVDPRDITDPKYASLFQAIAKKEAEAKGNEPAPQGPDPEAELQKRLTILKTQFKTWSDPRLQAGGITIDEVRKKPDTQRMLDSALANVAVAMESSNENLEKQAVEEYFNVAIAAIQAHNQNTGQQVSAVSGLSSVAGTANDKEQQVLQQLEQLGITKTALASLGKLMAQSAKGSTTVNNTGNPFLNAIAKMSGMAVK